MQNLAIGGYTEEQVKKALHSSSRVIGFRYELLDSSNEPIGQLDNYISAASIAYNAFADIKGTSQYTMKDNNIINLLSHRIKPYVRLRMPGYNWVEWAQGVYIPSTPPRKASALGVTRQIAAYDLLQVLVDGKVEDVYVVEAGENYITAVATLLTGAGFTKCNLTPTSKTLETTQEWDAGTTKLKIINELLGAISYKSLSMNENGIPVAIPYVSPAVRTAEYTYSDDEESVIFPEVEQTLDLFSIPNKWKAIVSESDRTLLTSTYTNTNANSQTSTVGRGGRTIMGDIKKVSAADQASLDAIVQRMAYEDSQIYDKTTFSSAIMPFHSDSDVLNLNFSKLQLAYKYSETGWSFNCTAASPMVHNVRRLVNI